MATMRKQTSIKRSKTCEPCSGKSFAFFLILVGIWWLAEDLGWFNFGISIWPFVVIFFGLYHLVHAEE